MTPAEKPATNTPRTDAAANSRNIGEGQSFIAFARQLETDLQAAHAVIAQMRELLCVAKCPDPNCDGQGSSWHVEYSGAGEPEQVQHQCQWCDEIRAALSQEGR